MNIRPVVIVTATPEVPVDLETVRSQLGGRAGVQVVPLPNRRLGSKEEEPFLRKMKEAFVIFQRSGFITRRIIDFCSQLKFVITHGAGVDMIDLQACKERGVWVGNVPGGNANAVAEIVIAGIIGLIRRLMTANASMHRGGWEKGRFLGREFSQGILGIIGLGNVGKRLVEIAKGFGTKIIFYDPYVTQSQISGLKGLTRCDNLEDLLKMSDYISIHVPLTKETTKSIGLKEFRMMKDECIVINTSRGDVIDEKALCIALKKAMIGGAVLDVFSEEPLSQDSQLRQFSNVILSPHIGGSTKECLRKIAETASGEILLVLSGRKPMNLVEVSALKIDLTSRA